MRVRCPRCKKEIEYEGSPFRPFCSERCRLIDLGEWAQEKYSVATEDQTDSTSSSKGLSDRSEIESDE